jgi:cytoskeletal protein CcmA (bactofilin family)
VTDQNTTIISENTSFKGEMSFTGTAIILGQFEGAIIADGEVQVGEGALCQAQVDALKIIVHGRIVGDIIGRERVELHETAQVEGDITAASLSVKDGAAFFGNCRVGEAAVAEATQGSPAGRASKSAPTRHDQRQVEARHPETKQAEPKPVARFTRQVVDEPAEIIAKATRREWFSAAPKAETAGAIHADTNTQAEAS